MQVYLRKEEASTGSEAGRTSEKNEDGRKDESDQQESAEGRRNHRCTDSATGTSEQSTPSLQQEQNIPRKQRESDHHAPGHARPARYDQRQSENPTEKKAATDAQLSK